MQEEYNFTQKVRMDSRHFSHAHVSFRPTHTRTFIENVVSKILTLVCALVLTFGTYAAAYPRHTAVMADSIRQGIVSIDDSYQKFVRYGMSGFQNHATDLVAAATYGVSNKLNETSYVFRSNLTSVVCSHDFLRWLFDCVENVMYQPADFVVANATTTSSTGRVKTEPIREIVRAQDNSNSHTVQTIINNQVIERIIERATPSQNINAVSPSLLSSLLARLEDRINHRIDAINVPVSNLPPQIPVGGFIGPGYTGTVGAQRIDQLTNTTINTPTINGG